MRVDDIRGQLRKRGVSGISALRKPDLVKQLVRSLRAESGGAARRSTGPAGRATGTRASAGRAAATKKAATRAAPSRAKAAPANKSAPAKRAAAKKTTAAKRTTAAAKKTTAAKRTTAAAKKTTAAKSTAARKTAAARKSTTARTAPARKAPAKKAAARPSAAKRAAPAKRAAAARPAGGGTAAGGIRTGRGTGRSVRSSQVISSIADRPERPGRSLITANHEVIQRWARERGAKPATIAGTEREGRAGVLTFNIPGYRESSRIREITWDEWFHTFDLRRLNLIYQEQMRDGRQSNFFRTESPDREDG
ncbi:hypothetical protein GA0070607_3097 [Micromonospora coriariae]|uniref:Rho termination factor, N-terminal domain n=1 Tax=Micromonospora coriariae TaxID=285665 RepID=A0A1C4W451_9ACTN|nr:hypothetical protein GA0070607_3097 [Micromonospora coriariae]